MRLVDADKILEMGSEEGMCYLEHGCDYDLDKVVDQLEQQVEQYRERGFEADRERACDFADKCYAKQCSYLRAIEIVKAGGMNE